MEFEVSTFMVVLLSHKDVTLHRVHVLVNLVDLTFGHHSIHISVQKLLISRCTDLDYV